MHKMGVRSRVLIFASALNLLLFTVVAEAFIAPERPQTGEFVADTVGLIGDGDKAEIQRIARKLFEDRKIPIVVVTIDSLLSFTTGEYLGIERYSRNLFDHWGIGSKTHNYGILVLVSAEDRIARIQFGGGWGFLYDEHAQEIMDDVIVPSFKNRNYSKGLVNAVEELDQLARNDLRFLFDKQKVWLLILMFLIITSVFTYLLVEKINSTCMRNQRILAGAKSGFYLFVLFLYFVGFLNKIEFWFVIFGCVCVALVSLLVFAVAYSQKYSFKETAVQVLWMLVMMLFIPMFFLFWILVMAKNDEYDSGTSETGGGATGSWD